MMSRIVPSMMTPERGCCSNYKRLTSIEVPGGIDKLECYLQFVLTDKPALLLSPKTKPRRRRGFVS